MEMGFKLYADDTDSLCESADLYGFLYTVFE
ncbi:hypothetical protein FLA105535_04145 [Flavobacterium bizetiae]|nr:hypothetical protein FLA105535_04145 [Flavobacterium bizetiae]